MSEHSLEDLYFRTDFNINTRTINDRFEVQISGYVEEIDFEFVAFGQTLPEAIEKAHEQIDAATYEHRLITDIVAMYRLAKEGLTLDHVLELVDLQAIRKQDLLDRHTENLALMDILDDEDEVLITDRDLLDGDLMRDSDMTLALLMPARIGRA